MARYGLQLHRVFIFCLSYCAHVWGGQLAAKYRRNQVISTVKLYEVGIGIIGVISFLTASLPLSLFTLACLGIHSALYGPSKFAALPVLVDKEHLMSANAYMNGGTFLFILAGTIMGSAFAPLAIGGIIISALIMISSIAGYFISRAITDIPAQEPDLRLSFNLPQQTWKTITALFEKDKSIVLSVMGIGWFYFLGGTFLSQMPNFVHSTLEAQPIILTLFLVLFSVGIAAGGFLNTHFLKGRIEATYVPLSLLLITAFTLDLQQASHYADAKNAGFFIFFESLANWRIAFDFFLISVAGGLFVVPLNAMVQHKASDADRPGIMAANAIVNAAFVVLSVIVTSCCIMAGFSIPDIFLIISILNAIVFVYSCRLLPGYLLKAALQGAFKFIYRVEVKGLENMPPAGQPAVIVANHVSLLDPPLLAAFLPGKPMFAVNTQVAEWWWVKPFLKLIDAFPLDPTNTLSVKALIKEVKTNKKKYRDFSGRPPHRNRDPNEDL